MKRIKKADISFSKIILVLTLCLAVLILLGFISLMRSTYTVNSSFSWVLVSDSGPVTIISHQQEGKSGSIFLLNSDVKVESAKNLGQYTLGNIYKLGEQQKIGGGSLLKATIEQNFFVPVDAYLYYNRTIQTHDRLLEASFLRNIILKSMIFSSSKSDFSFADKFRLFVFFSRSRLNYWDKIDLRDINSSADFSSAVNKDIFYASFIDSLLDEKNYSLGIVNKSSCEKAASKNMQLFENLGFRVIEFKSAGEKEEYTHLLAKSNQNIEEELTVRIRKILAISKLQKKDFSDPVDLILVIGEDYCRL